MRSHEPELYEGIARIALPKDYVRLRLCGEHVIDVADASGTLLLDVAQRRWSDEVVQELGFDPAWLPEVMERPPVSGATRSGGPVDQGIPLGAGAGDPAAGALGGGV